MNIAVYEDASTLPEEYFPSLADAQIECWWSRPFDEYKICQDEKCRALYSIEDVFWSIENFNLKKDKNTDFKCEDCWQKTDFIYDKELFIENIREYIKWEVSVVLLLNNSKVEGFWVTIIKTLKELLDLELWNRPKSYKEHFLITSDLWKKLNEKFSCINHIYVSKEYRWKWYWKKLLFEIFNFLQMQQNQIVTETRYDSDFYSICKSIWFEWEINDKYWYILMFLKKNWYINQDNINSIFNDISTNFLKYKQKARSILNINSSFSHRKAYI